MDRATESQSEDFSDNQIDFDELSYFNGRLAFSLRNVPEALLDKPEAELVEDFDFSSTDWLLRRRFWELIDLAKRNKTTSIPTAAIFDGICSKQNFTTQYLEPGKEHKLAWILKPIRDYKELCDQTFNVGMEKVLRFVQKTKVSESNLAKILRLLEFSANRKHGPVIQRMQIHQRNEHVSADSNTKDVTPEITATNMQEQIANLSTKLIGSNDDKEE
jgi:hypothetical protein